jgi:hypothetical protein
VPASTRSRIEKACPCSPFEVETRGSEFLFPFIRQLLVALRGHFPSSRSLLFIFGWCDTTIAKFRRPADEAPETPGAFVGKGCAVLIILLSAAGGSVARVGMAYPAGLGDLGARSLEVVV